LSINLVAAAIASNYVQASALTFGSVLHFQIFSENWTPEEMPESRGESSYNFSVLDIGHW
jgi:hypothetical protein